MHHIRAVIYVYEYAHIYIFIHKYIPNVNLRY